MVSRQQSKTGVWQKRLVLVLVGLLVGMCLAELAVIAYEQWGMWLPFRAPPRFLEDKTDGVRIALLGGSTANGYPYYEIQGMLASSENRTRSHEPTRPFNLLSITQLFLEQRYGRPVTVDAYCGPGFAAGHTVAQYWKNARHKPDIMVLYSGNNELAADYPRPAVLPRWVSPLVVSRAGSLLLRRAYAKQASADSEPPVRTFFRDPVPQFLVDYAHWRYRRYVELLIDHCREAGIFLVVVIPQGNHQAPPIGSAYIGPPARREEALRLFKRAYALKYFQSDLAASRSILEDLLTFCRFSDVCYELGDIHLRQGRMEGAARYLAEARDIDAGQSMITSQRRALLRDVVREHDVPCIDTHDVIAAHTLMPFPGDKAFLDDCHLTLGAYEALSRELIGVLGKHRAGGLLLPDRDLAVRDEEWRSVFGFAAGSMHLVRALTALQVVNGCRDAGDFLLLATFQRVSRTIRAAADATGLPWLVEMADAVERDMEWEKSRARKWLDAEG